MCNRLTLSIALLSLLAGGLLAGCGQSDVSWQGPEDKLVKKVKPGKTTEAEVTGLFGQPAKTETTPAGTKILQYEALKSKADAADSPIGVAETVRQERYVYFFEIDQGVVVRAWKTHATLDKHTAVNQPLVYPAAPAMAPVPSPVPWPTTFAPPPAGPTQAPMAGTQPTGVAPPSAATVVGQSPAPAPTAMAYAPAPYPAPAYYYAAPPAYYYPAPPMYYYYPGPVAYPWPYVGLNFGFRFGGGWRR